MFNYLCSNLVTAKTLGTRPYRTRTSMGHGFEVGPKFFEIHGFTRFCGFLTRESKKSNVVLMGNTQFFMSNLSWQLFCEAWFLRNTLFFMSNLLWSLNSKKGMVFLVEFAMPNLLTMLWSLISKKYTVFHVKLVMLILLSSFIFQEKKHGFSCQTVYPHIWDTLYIYYIAVTLWDTDFLTVWHFTK